MSIAPAINSEAIITHLNKILGSDQFAGAFRIKKLLKYLVEETLADRTDQIKAYTIAMSVFNRDTDFDPQADPIVRITAGRLRRHLDDYYENCGPEETIRITIPKGAYVPRFDRIQPSPKYLTTLDKAACEVFTPPGVQYSGSYRRPKFCKFDFFINDSY